MDFHQMWSLRYTSILAAPRWANRECAWEITISFMVCSLNLASEMHNKDLSFSQVWIKLSLHLKFQYSFGESSIRLTNGSW